MVEPSLPTQGVVGSIPGGEAESLHTLWAKNQNIKWKQYCNKFNKDFKKGLYKKS